MCVLYSQDAFYHKTMSLAGFYNETMTLEISAGDRIECRAFVTEIPEVPCCNDSNHKSLCQPDTGIARVGVDVLSASHPKASTWCRAGVDLNAIPELALNDTCPPDGQPEYCRPKPVHSGFISTLMPASDSPVSTPQSPGMTVVTLLCCAIVVRC